ncbi:hypothetical protein [Nisaea nitritireducens]|uniref:hypothetical protein n=1 Tax=Nisaea nitritireducens TaxID=568392 RepID=UPI001869344B|nr:hypothetical protein [Nisaea nitritireducens]
MRKLSRQTRWKLASAFVVGAFLSVSIQTASFGADDSLDDNAYGSVRPNYSSVSLDLALIRKIRADEMYIRDGTCRNDQELLKSTDRSLLLNDVSNVCAKISKLDTGRVIETVGGKAKQLCPIAAKYCDAYTSASNVSPTSLSPAKQNTRELILRDIEYRLLLLDQKLAFWGGARSLTPSVPIQHVRVMESLLDDLEKQVVEMLRFLSEIEEDAESANRLKAYAEQVRGRFQAETTRQSKAEVIRLENQQRQRIFGSRIESLERQRRTLLAEAEALRDEAEQLSNQAENAVLNAVASSVGAPPGLLTAVQQGDIKAAALTALTDEAVGKEIGEIVKGFGDTTQQFVELYQQGQELHRQFEEAKETLDGAKDFLRKPTTDKLLRLGSMVAKKLPPDARDIINDKVNEIAPVLGLIDTVRTLRGKRPAEICKAVRNNTLVSSELNIVDKAPCGLLELTLPKACDRTMLEDGNLERHCKNFGLLPVDGTLCQSLRNGCRVQDRLATHINELDGKIADITFRVEEAIIDVIDDAGSEYAVVYTDAMKRLVEVIETQDEWVDALDEILRIWSMDSLKFVLSKTEDGKRAKVIELLFKHLKVQEPADADENAKIKILAEAIAQYGIRQAQDAIPRIRVTQDFKLEVAETEGGIALVSFDAKDLFAHISPDLLDKESSRLKSNLRRSFQKLAGKRNNLRKGLLRHIKPGQTEELVKLGISRTAENANPDNPNEEQARQETWVQLAAGDERHVVRDFGTNLVVGRTVAVDLRNEIPKLPESTSPIPPAAGEGAPGIDVSKVLAEQAVKRALDAVLPGAGVALEVLQGLAALDANIGQQQRIAADSVRVALQMVEAQEAVDQALYQSVLAEKDEAIAAALRQAAARQLQIYNFGIKQSARNAGLARSKIKLRRALTFYAAERLREEYDLFNRSMGLWGGYYDQPSSTVTRLIKSDPRNLRLALDPQIHLFGWLDREGEATRTDVDRLMLHWRQLLRLSQDICQTRGCTPGAGRLGQTAQTRLLRLSEIISEQDFEKFRNWQSGADSNVFRSTILLHPALKEYPPAYRNLRFVDIRAGWERFDNTFSIASGVTVTHPGTATVAGVSIDDPTRTQFYREVLLPRRTSSFDIPLPYDLGNLRNRWEDDNDREAGIFEGYGLYTTLELSVYPTVEAKAASDLAFRIAFAYTDPENVVTEADFVTRASFSNLVSDLKVNPYAQALCFTTGDEEIECRPHDEVTVPPIAAAMLPLDDRLEARRNAFLGNLNRPNNPNTPSVSLRLCNRTWTAIRSELREFITAEIIDERMDPVRPSVPDESGQSISSYEQLEALQRSIKDREDAQVALIVQELNSRQGQLKGCPHPIEENG